MTTLAELESFTAALLQVYFDALKGIGNKYHTLTADIIPHDRFLKLKKDRDIRETLKAAESLISEFLEEHKNHMEVFWEHVADLEVQEVEAKKILNAAFVKFQNVAWHNIKILRHRAEEYLDAFELLGITKPEIEWKLKAIKEITFEQIRDSWILQNNILG